MFIYINYTCMSETYTKKNFKGKIIQDIVQYITIHSADVKLKTILINIPQFIKNSLLH